jgi:hypothetical protein
MIKVGENKNFKDLKYAKFYETSKKLYFRKVFLKPV